MRRELFVVDIGRASSQRDDRPVSTTNRLNKACEMQPGDGGEFFWLWKWIPPPQATFTHRE